MFSRFDVVELALVYVSNEQAGTIVTPLHVDGSPDLVVEIGSPGARRRDETIKRKLYERAGVLKYLHLDPRRQPRPRSSIYESRANPCCSSDEGKGVSLETAEPFVDPGDLPMRTVTLSASTVSVSLPSTYRRWEG